MIAVTARNEISETFYNLPNEIFGCLFLTPLSSELDFYDTHRAPSFMILGTEGWLWITPPLRPFTLNKGIVTVIDHSSVWLIYLNLSLCLTSGEAFGTFLFCFSTKVVCLSVCLSTLRDHVFVIAQSTLVYPGYTHPSHSFYGNIKIVVGNDLLLSR